MWYDDNISYGLMLFWCKHTRADIQSQGCGSRAVYCWCKHTRADIQSQGCGSRALFSDVSTPEPTSRARVVDPGLCFSDVSTPEPTSRARAVDPEPFYFQFWLTTEIPRVYGLAQNVSTLKYSSTLKIIFVHFREDFDNLILEIRFLHF